MDDPQRRPARTSPDELVDDRYLLDTFLENTPDGVYFKDAQSRFIRISRALAERFGLDDAAEAIGRTDFDFFSAEHARQAFADEQHLMRMGEALIGIEELETWEDGRESWVSTTKVPLLDRAGKIAGVFGISRDITERKRSEQRLALQAEQLERQAKELQELSLVDDLTGLHNRRALTALGEEALYRARRDGTPLALLFLDVDGLKQINDTFGHTTGDEALRALSGVIIGAIREADVAARFGGDEFCVLLADQGPSAVERVVERIRSALGAFHDEEALPFDLSVSIGVLNVDPRAPGSLEDMLGEADRSMYDEKLGRVQVESG